MQSQPLRVDVKGAAPIPVGHTVEVWLLKVEGGMLSGDTEGPMVRHTETGILYGPSWAYEGDGALIPQAAPSQLQLHPSVRIVSQSSGRVVHCRVASTPSKWLDQVTTLLVQRT